jgi:hypothetical protein
MAVLLLMERGVIILIGLFSEVSWLTAVFMLDKSICHESTSSVSKGRDF